jgi:hypothetical protein
MGLRMLWELTRGTYYPRTGTRRRLTPSLARSVPGGNQTPSINRRWEPASLIGIRFDGGKVIREGALALSIEQPQRTEP